MQKTFAMSVRSIHFARISLTVLLTIISIGSCDIHDGSAEEPTQLIACSQPDVFTVQITENENVVVYDTELLIKYSPYVGIFSFPGIDPVNVVFNESIIEFRGYMSPEYPVTRPDLSPERLSWTSSGIILGIGTLQKLSSEDYVVRECRLFLPKNIKSSANLPKAVEDAVVRYAHTCITVRLCQGLGPMKAEELRNINRYDELGPNSLIQRLIRPNNSQRQDSPINLTTSVDLNVNAPVDMALKNVIKYIEQNGLSTIAIPDISETHTVGPLDTKSNFQAVGGTFEDLSTLKRTEDAFLSSVGQKYVIKAGFGLSTARFNYNHYKIKFGFMKVSGKILGTVEGLALAAKIVIDYDKECNAHVEYIKVTQLGKIKIKMTGLGILNDLTSKLITWLTKKWQNDIVELIEINLMNIAEKQISKYVCNL